MTIESALRKFMTGKTNVTHPTDTHRINNCHFHYIIM